MDEDLAAWSRLAYTLASADDGPLRCVEATRVADDEQPAGVLSRWCLEPTPDSPADLVVESAATQAASGPADLAQRAVVALRAWSVDRQAVTGDVSREVLGAAWRVAPDSVAPAADVLVVDGVPLPGTLARAGDVTARVVDRGDHVVAVVHHAGVAAPVRLVTAMPVIGQPTM